jgi:hypothetical protein
MAEVFGADRVEPHVIRQQDGIDVTGDLAILRCA